MKPQNSQMTLTQSEIENWLISYLCQLLEIEPTEVDITVAFDRYGLDSSAVVSLSGDLQEWLGKPIDPTILYDYPTIEALARHLTA